MAEEQQEDKNKRIRPRERACGRKMKKWWNKRQEIKNQAIYL